VGAAVGAARSLAATDPTGAQLVASAANRGFFDGFTVGCPVASGVADHTDQGVDDGSTTEALRPRRRRRRRRRGRRRVAGAGQRGRLSRSMSSAWWWTSWAVRRMTSSAVMDLCSS